MNTILIPARLDSKRFPRKLLQVCKDGRTLLEHTWTNAVERAKEIDAEVFICTSDYEIYQVADKFGAAVAQTNEHECGTDRVAEAVKELHLSGVIYNWQADVPQLPLSLNKIQTYGAAIGTCHYRQNSPLKNNPNQVKLVQDCYGKVLYFSREAIPYVSEFQDIHVGIYCYHSHTLKNLITEYCDENYDNENLEQLDWLYNQYIILTTNLGQKVFNIDSQEDFDEYNATLNC